MHSCVTALQFFFSFRKVGLSPQFIRCLNLSKSPFSISSLINIHTTLIAEQEESRMQIITKTYYKTNMSPFSCKLARHLTRAFNFHPNFFSSGRVFAKTQRHASGMIYSGEMKKVSENLINVLRSADSNNTKSLWEQSGREERRERSVRLYPKAWRRC